MKPLQLQKGDRIGIVAPASPCPMKKWKKAVSFLTLLGYEVELGESVYHRVGYLSGSDELRAKDLNQMFADPTIKAIFCLRGGYGVTRILPFLDYEQIQKQPKILIGYSDITALHLAIHQTVGLTTFHGPILAEFGERIHFLTGWYLFSLCSETKPLGRYPIPSDSYTLTEGEATGELIGGNLSLLTASLGTSYELETSGKILFIEEVGEQPYRIDRMLTQLLQAGKLQSARGIILASFTNCDASNPSQSLMLKEVFADRIGSLGIPAYYGLYAGHCSPNLTLPIGGKAKMNASERWLELIEGNVRSN